MRLASTAIRFLPSPVCLHEHWRPWGKARDGRPRNRCRQCGRTRVEWKHREYGMYLAPHKIQAANNAFAAGLSTRAAARQAGISPVTAFKLRRLSGYKTLCPCGQPSGHRGWCAVRFAQSKLRQVWMRRWHLGIKRADLETFQELLDAMKESDPLQPPTSETFKAGAILLAGLWGRNVETAQALTGYDKDFVGRVARRLTENGIWTSNGVLLGDPKECDVGFWLGAMVGEGTLRRHPGGRYSTIPIGDRVREALPLFQEAL